MGGSLSQAELNVSINDRGSKSPSRSVNQTALDVSHNMHCMMAQSEKMYRQQMEYLRQTQDDNIRMMQMMMDSQLKLNLQNSQNSAMQHQH